MSNEAVRAIQALRILREHGELRGHDFAAHVRATLNSSSSPLPPRAELEPILLLLDAGLIQVYLKSEQRPGGPRPTMSAERFRQTWAQFGLEQYVFSVAEHLSYVQRALGIFNLSEMEQRAQGDSLVVAPLFGLPRNTTLRRSVYALLPPTLLLRPVYERAIRPAAEGLNLTVGRAEDFFRGRASVIEIWEALYSTAIVIGDCTGGHPGVFYELGIAHTLGRHTITIAQQLDDIPLEFRQLHHIVYDISEPGLTQLCSELQALLMAIAREGSGAPA